MFGDEETFKELCEEAAQRGIRIILDGVFKAGDSIVASSDSKDIYFSLKEQ